MEGPQPPVGSYVVVVDETAESALALRFAALRAARVGARLTLVHVLPKTEFMQWGAVQQAIEAEAEAKADALLAGVADQVMGWTGARPSLIVARGETTTAVLETLRGDSSIRALVLGAAQKGHPGPLVDFFAGERAGQLPCLVMIVPGGLSEERLAELT